MNDDDSQITLKQSTEIPVEDLRFELLQTQITSLNQNIGDYRTDMQGQRDSLETIQRSLHEIINSLLKTQASPENHDLFKSEYEKIKEEQLERIKIRNSVFLFQCGAIGAIMTHILSKDGTALEYLVIPWASTVFAWIAYREDLITEEIKKVLERKYGKVLAWDCEETAVMLSNIRDYRKSKNKQLEFLLFFFPSAIAILAAYFQYWNRVLVFHPPWIKLSIYTIAFVVNTLNATSLFLIAGYFNRKKRFENETLPEKGTKG
ncbi:MAG: hypothetical protein QM758_13175 [Armatimonas sp.]